MNQTPRHEDAWKKRARSGKLTGGMRKKLAALFLVTAVGLVALLIRITYINAVSKDQYTRQVLSNSQSQYVSQAIAYKRGNIIDSTGTVLATSTKKYNVILDCKVVNSKEDYLEPTVTALKEVLGLNEGTIRTLLADEKTKDSQYQVIEKDISIEEKKKFDSYVNDTEKLSESEAENRANVQGVWFEEEYVRSYPMKSLACDVIGFTNDGDEADWGIEGYYNPTLKGVNGRKYAYYGSGSTIEQTIVDAVDGQTVQSTLDANIQAIAEKYIKKFEDTYASGPYSETKAAANVGILVMNPNDGSVLAMASSDPYDLNSPRDLSAFYTKSELKSMTDNARLEALEKLWRNYCISDAYEPGSTFKPVTMSSALETGAIGTSDTYVCDGYEIVSGTRIRCSNTSGHGEETLSQIIANSCNDGMMQIGAKLGIDNFCNYQQLFGFGSRTGIDLSGEASGIIGASDTMGSVDLATASFGQGFTCTMIQEASAIASIINGGTYYKPRIVSRILNADGTTARTMDKVVMKETVSKDVSDLLRSYMKESVDSGTSMFAKVDGYSMGGKTGTAQKIPRGNGKYLVSWIGFAPYVNPQVEIYVVVDEPNVEEQADSRYPQWIARDALREILPYMNIYPDEETKDNIYQKMDLGNPRGEDPVVDEAADTNVPEPSGQEDAANTAGGNTEETDGVTNAELTN
ncbi:MAG: penicillin-binding transpeptidase domain-containing protein [Lachnospiraceae bacterium]|nr:penicillin-binding transpeptidase domain-containing protein [Lachnospiraceae bacterium]